MHLHGAQDECCVGPGHPEFGQFRSQRPLDGEEQLRGPVAFVGDPQKVLALDQYSALRTGQ